MTILGDVKLYLFYFLGVNDSYFSYFSYYLSGIGMEGSSEGHLI